MVHQLIVVKESPSKKAPPRASGKKENEFIYICIDQSYKTIKGIYVRILEFMIAFDETD